MKIRIIILTYVSLALACDSPNYIIDYPQIDTAEITSVSTSGITVSGTFKESLFNQIIDYGLVWGPTPDLDIAADFTQHEGRPTSITWSVDVRDDLLQGKEYFIKPFIVTDRDIIYGRLLKFMSQGSEGPVIESISPEIVKQPTNITITGKRFGNSETTKVFFRIGLSHEIEAEATSLGDEQIVVVYPEMFVDSAKVVIRRRENTEVVSSGWVIQPLPRLTSAVATDVCSDIELIGENLLLFGEPTSLMVNDKSVSTSSLSDNSLTLDNTFQREHISVSIKYSNSYTYSRGFRDLVALPIVTGEAPETMPASLTFDLQGENFPTCGGLEVHMVEGPYFGEDYFKITNVTETTVTIQASFKVCDSFSINLSYHGDVIYTSKLIAKPPGC